MHNNIETQILKQLSGINTALLYWFNKETKNERHKRLKRISLDMLFSTKKVLKDLLEDEKIKPFIR
jgi:hypothetical protein